MPSFDDVLAHVLTKKPFLTATTPRALLAHIEEAALDFEHPIDAVIWHASSVDRLGLAFTAGYSVATRVLSAGLGASLPGHTSLAATEAGGAHPRAIETKLEREGTAFSLTGSKLWCTLAFEASHLVVVAKEGEHAGRPLLRAVIVPVGREGVTLEAMPDAPFCPEVQHATVTLSRVPIAASEIATVDAYADVLKPFRTIEDSYVHAALLAWLTGVAVHEGFAPEIAERSIALVAASRSIASLAPLASATHRALAGVIDETNALLAACEAEWERAASEITARYRRDLPLISIAGRARRARLERARAESV